MAFFHNPPILEVQLKDYQYYLLIYIQISLRIEKFTFNLLAKPNLIAKI